MDQAVRFVPVFLFLPGVLGTASADTRCARHCLSFCFALVSLRYLGKRTAQRFRSHHKVPGLTPFASPAKNFAVPRKSTFPSLGATSLAFFVPKHSRAERRKLLMNLNQLSIIGFIGKNAETKYLPNGTPVTKFSVATKKSWKDENNEWKEKTQWHNVVAFGKGFEQLADRLVKGAHVFVQGELTTREYDRTIKVSTGKGENIEHVIQQLVVELKADTIRTLDRSTS